MRLVPVLVLALSPAVFGQLATGPHQIEPSAPVTITAQALELRLAELERGRTQALANLHAYDGAIQECQYWLAVVKPKEPQSPTAESKAGEPAGKSEQANGTNPKPAVP